MEGWKILQRSVRFFFWGGGGVFFSNQEIGVHELSMGTLNYRKLYLSNCG